MLRVRRSGLTASSSVARRKGIVAPARKRLPPYKLLSGRTDDPDWLFRQCHRIAKALTDRNITLAQIYGMGIPIIDLDREQLKQLANTAPFLKANFNPDQSRDAHGRWTDQGSTGGGRPSRPTPRISPRSNYIVVAPRDSHPAAAQLVADNQRENKMVRDIVVQLKLSRDEQEKLHRYISGQGYSYR